MTEPSTPTLETERLSLRPMTMDDMDLMVDLDSDPEVMRFITDGKPQTKGHYEKRMPEVINYMSENPGLGLWVTFLKDSNEFVGWYILKHLPDNGEVEVGFRIKKKFWNKGYSTEAGKRLLKHGFETLGLEKIAAIVRPDNYASQAVIKKIGLREKGSGVWYGIECLYFELDKAQTTFSGGKTFVLDFKKAITSSSVFKESSNRTNFLASAL